MRDQDNRTVPEPLLDIPPDTILPRSIERAHRFIQNENIRIAQQGSGKPHALALPVRQTQPHDGTHRTGRHGKADAIERCSWSARISHRNILEADLSGEPRESLIACRQIDLVGTVEDRADVPQRGIRTGRIATQMRLR
jgi:hypothetical protein